MTEGVKTFALCTVSKRMTVQFSPEGLDIIRCLLARWLTECRNNAEKARVMERESDNPLMRGQADYWSHSGSFIKGKIINNTAHKFNCYNELKDLAKWSEDGTMPEGWEVFDTSLITPELPHGTVGTPPGGSGGDRDGADSTTGPVKGRGRKVKPGKGDGPHPNPDSAGVGGKNRKGSQRKGKVRTE